VTQEGGEALGSTSPEVVRKLIEEVGYYFALMFEVGL
jgi:hypothetical protein